MQNIKKVITVLLLISSVNIQANDIKNRFFISFLAGYSKLKVTNNKDFSKYTMDSKALDNDGFVSDICFGYRYDKNIFFTTNIQQTQLDKVSIENYYISANYRYDDIKYNPSIGFLIGYSQLRWGQTPIKETISSDLKLGGTLYGLQAGASKKLKDNLFLVAKYQFIYLDHDLKIDYGIATIDHKYQNNLSIGIKYEF
jgi:hypothetical protein